MSKVLIFNALPTNNGDAALVFSLYEALNKKGVDVKIASHKSKLIKQKYGDRYPIVPEITDFDFFEKLYYRMFFKSILTPLLYFFSPDFMKADVLIASPGGYINSYYGFSRVALTLVVGKILGKKTVIYSQSIGPLNKKDSSLLKILSNFVDLIYVRDKFSYDETLRINLNSKKIRKTNDAAFLIPFDQKSNEGNTIAISVRSWKHDERSSEQYHDMIRELARTLINKGFKVEFISTCQGLESYVDDSKVADEIVSVLEKDIRENITVNKEYFTLEQLMIKLESFKAVIGTRLHMCILSMLKGKPCLNISYEVKGKEAYSYLGLSEYTIDYNEEVRSALRHLDFFLDTLDEKEKSLKNIMYEQNLESLEHLNYLLERLKISYNEPNGN